MQVTYNRTVYIYRFGVKQTLKSYRTSVKINHKFTLNRKKVTYPKISFLPLATFFTSILSLARRPHFQQQFCRLTIRALGGGSLTKKRNMNTILNAEATNFTFSLAYHCLHPMLRHLQNLDVAFFCFSVYPHFLHSLSPVEVVLVISSDITHFLYRKRHMI